MCSSFQTWCCPLCWFLLLFPSNWSPVQKAIAYVHIFKCFLYSPQSSFTSYLKIFGPFWIDFYNLFPSNWSPVQKAIAYIHIFKCFLYSPQSSPLTLGSLVHFELTFIRDRNLVCFLFFVFFFCTGVWTQGLHLKPLRQTSFVVGSQELSA
jgi:hypothetical protein